MKFQQKLDNLIKQNNSLLCVGLDNGSSEFNKKIIDSTADLVCAYKPNTAFFEARGAKGISELEKTCAYLRKNYQQIPIILDAKRGDIGSTNAGYVKFAFDLLQADAITVQPYLGSESLAPFLELQDKGIIILCKTSNTGSGEIQNLKVNKQLLYFYIARQVKVKWNKNNNCLLVVGATYPQELSEIRKIVGDMTLLIPGIGIQGGDIKKSLSAGLNSKKSGLIINVSRAIINSDNPRREAKKFRDEINKYRNI